MAGKFVVSKGKNGQDYFVLKAANGQVILQSEGYTTRRACSGGIQSVKKNAGKESAYEVKTAKNGAQYFLVKSANGQTIGKSQMYKSASGCKNGMKSVAANAPDAPVIINE